MKTQRKHGFTIVELVVVIAVIAILAAVLIPTFVSIIKKANDSAYVQERQSQRIDDIAQKIDNETWVSWEDMEIKISNAIAGISNNNPTRTEVEDAIKKAIEDYAAAHQSGNTGVTPEQVQKIVEETTKGNVTLEQVQALIAKIPTGSTGVTAAQVQSIVNQALAGVSASAGLNATQVNNLIKSYLESHPTENAEAIKKAVEDALANVKTLSEEDVVAIVNNITNQMNDVTTVLTGVEGNGAGYTSNDTDKVIYLITNRSSTQQYTITSKAGQKVVIDAPNMTNVVVAGESDEIVVFRTAMTSVHITGTVGKVEVNSGRVEVESGATVTTVTAAPSTNATTVVEVMVGATVENPIVAEYQDNGFGTNDYIQIIDHNTVEEKKVKVELSSSAALAVSNWTTTNVVLNDVSASNVVVDDDSKDSLTDAAVGVTVNSGSGESTVLQTTKEGTTTEKVEATLTIGGTPFEEFNAEAAAAINDLEDGTVVLNNNATIRYSGYFITIPADHNVTIDLNGHTITAVATNGGTSAFILNQGTLILMDSKAGADGIGDGKITVTATDPDNKDIPGYASNLITNNGTLTVNSGVYENQVQEGYASYAIDNQTNGNLFTPVLTINGGKFVQSANSTYAVRMFCNSTTNVNKVTVNGGIIEGGYAFWMHTPNNNANMAELVINGGEFIAHDGYAVYFGGSGSTTEGRQYSNTSVIINGGTLNRVMMGGVSSVEKAPKTFEINGGKIAELALGSNISPIIRGGVYNSSIISTYGYVYIVDGEVYSEDNYGNKSSKYDSPWDKKAYWEEQGYTFEYDSHYGDYVVKITKSINDIIGDYLDSDYQLVDNGDGTSSVVHK